MTQINSGKSKEHPLLTVCAIPIFLFLNARSHSDESLANSVISFMSILGRGSGGSDPYDRVGKLIADRDELL